MVTVQPTLIKHSILAIRFFSVMNWVTLIVSLCLALLVFITETWREIYYMPYQSYNNSILIFFTSNKN